MRIVRLLAAFGLAVGSLVVLASSPAAAAITVTTTADEDNSDGDCSLREAVGSINTGSARDACGSTSGPITVPAGTYPINSDLTITAAMSIEGAGAGATILDSSGLVGSSVFNADLAPSFALSGVTIRGGADYYVNAQCAGAPSLTVTDSVFDGPTRYGVNNCNGTITIERTSINSSGDYGVNNNSGSVTMADSAVVGSDSYGVNANAGSITLTRTTVADSGSYGINANGGNVTLTNSTVSDAGSYLINTNQGAITLSSSTVVGSDGFGINSNAAASITNSVIGDTADDNCDLTGVTSGGFNTTNDESCGLDQDTDIVTDDLGLGPLAGNGGVGPTHLPTAGSALIDTGGACPADDQRGLPRPADGDEDGDAVCDRGAVEVQVEEEPVDPGATTTTTTSTPPGGGAAAVTPRFTG